MLCTPLIERKMHVLLPEASFSFTAPRPECTTDPECLLHLACLQQKCQDPCKTLRCGRNAECKVNSHRAYCVCKRGYEGDPQRVCEEREYPLCASWHELFLNAIIFMQPGARATLSAVTTRPALTGNARTPVSTESVAPMPSVSRAATGPTAYVLPTMMEIHLSAACPMSAW